MQQFTSVAAIILAYCVAIEGVAYVAAGVLVQRNLLYAPPALGKVEDSTKEQDPILGWPTQEMLAQAYDEHGARPNPFFPLPLKTCVSLYGGSFTFGSSTSDESTWGSLLSKQLGCRVANYGVVGYGTDQAYLRYSLNRADEAPVVVLTHLSSDIRRNVNQFRNLISHEQSVLLKPRFIFEKGDLLTYIPPPRLAANQAAEFIRSPASLLPHDYFLPGSGHGVIEATFPFTLAVGRLLFSSELQARMQSTPVWAEFYDPFHRSRALQITTGILERFAREARERGQKPFVALVPDASELFYSIMHGGFVYASLREGLVARGVEVVDVGQKILEVTRGQNLCALSANGDCSGELNEAGNRVVAKIIAGIFQETGESKVQLLEASSSRRN